MSARQALPKVVPLHPQTGEDSFEQTGGMGAQFPAAPTVHSPSGGLQNSPVAQVAPPCPPQATP
jgi:hypothetical protein